jgi:prephenate dehydrogenase
MAGGTSSGAGAADASLFEGRLVVMTPERADAAAVATVRALWEGVGARVIETSAARHDRLVARVSHLPQTLAWVLAATVGGDAERDALVEVAASGLRDMTRLAASDFDMWRAILAANRDEVSAALDAFCEVLTALRTAVERGDEAALDELVGRARALREDLDS